MVGWSRSVTKSTVCSVMFCCEGGSVKESKKQTSIHVKETQRISAIVNFLRPLRASICQKLFGGFKTDKEKRHK